MMDPDPHIKCGSGSRGRKECGTKGIQKFTIGIENPIPKVFKSDLKIVEAP